MEVSRNEVPLRNIIERNLRRTGIRLGQDNQQMRMVLAEMNRERGANGVNLTTVVSKDDVDEITGSVSLEVDRAISYIIDSL